MATTGIMHSARRRLQVLRNIFKPPGNVQSRLCSDSGSVRIGDIVVPRRNSKNPELIPINYVTGELSQQVMRHLRWMAQKDLLGQDMFLIGPPGPFRRTLAMQYLELVNREMEYVSLSRDTTETDLKQRREITSSTAHYVDQCAVKAALNGRVLVIDGIEKAERNVLPVINNLLENREMQLEDGRFLMAAPRYDKLLTSHSKQELDSWKLVRVSEDFRVIALGLPIPRYRGHPLDPPLRSRFQGRDVGRLPFHELIDMLRTRTSVPDAALNKILSFAYMFVSKEAENLGLPDFPMDSLFTVLKLLESLPELPAVELLHRIYPFDIFVNKEGRVAVEDALKKFSLVEASFFDKKDDLGSKATSESRYEIVEAVHDDCTTNRYPHVNIHLRTSQLLGSHASLKVRAGTRRNPTASSIGANFVSTKTHQALLSQMVQSHFIQDFCLVGPKGSGKSVLVKEFARILGYHIEPFVLYRDVTSRDLLQQRATLPTGDTVWRSSPLVTAALEGKLLVLDGIHRVDGGTLAVLHRLVHNRELQLYDGTRLLSSKRYAKIKEEHGFSDEEMSSRGLWCIHPSFRIVALAEPPETGSGISKRWLDAELLSLFLYHHLRPVGLEQEVHILSHLGIKLTDKIKAVLNVGHALRNSSDPALQSLSASLSTRQLIRLSNRLNSYPDDCVHTLIQNACLSRFLPPLTKEAFDSVLDKLSITPKTAQASPISLSSSDDNITCEVKNGIVRIGQTKVPLHNPDSPSKVPDIVFYDIPQHLLAMESMLKDFLLDEHLLLIGNQGVGKNKIVDRFLQLLNRPREYIQLHRDTTVQSLTLQPTVQDGVIVYEDSPLVRALKLGHILVVDEADKAPAHVVCVLKTLLESGEMLLSDGRRVLLPSAAKEISASNMTNHLVMHPDFRMIVLANRPGFPFLGNDFYSALGDIFACHPIDNPDFQSEMTMLKQYGPNVPDGVLIKLIRAFGELRTMADSGLLSYPYSTREAVNIVRHLQEFPNDSLTAAVRNIFDFDSYGKETVETLTKVLKKHGIPIGILVPDIHLATEYELPSVRLFGKWKLRERIFDNYNFITESRPIRISDPILVYSSVLPLDKVDHRASKFSELHCSWKLPMHYTNIVTDVKVSRDDQIKETLYGGLRFHVATSNPIQLYTFGITSPTVTCLDLNEIFPAVRRGTFKPRIRIAVLGNSSDIFLFDEMSGTKVLVDAIGGKAKVIEEPTLVDAAEGFIRRIGNSQTFHHLCTNLSATDQVLVNFRPYFDTIEIMNLKNSKYSTITLPFNLLSVYPVRDNAFVLVKEDQQRCFLRLDLNSAEGFLHEFDESSTDLNIEDVIPPPLSSEVAAAVVPSGVAANATIPVFIPETYGSLAVGLGYHPEMVEFYGISRSVPSANYVPDVVEGDSATRHGFDTAFAVIPNEATFVRIQDSARTPAEANREGKNVNFLEIVDLCNRHVRYMPVEKPLVVSPYAAWLTTRPNTGNVLCPTGEGSVAVADLGGTVHLYEIGSAALRRSLADWRKMLGDAEQRHLQVTIQRRSGKPVSGPKVGKIDPTNAPHVGGNTWAGGTGGRDTAGLGGMGGPFRLDSGNTVFQVSDLEKAAVPEEVRKAAREMALKAHAERLREIKMSAYDAEEYERFSSSIRSQVQLLRNILEGLQAKGKERQWLHHQTTGEMDDIKIVEGLTGEKNVFKRRGEQDPEPGSPQQLPKRLKLVVDVSGSMYRFNGYDRRLERMLEAALMVMEAFESHENKFKYEIIGHSGEDFSVSFVTGKDVPKNNKERMDVLKMMNAHAQFCISGDNTIEATAHAIKKMVEEEKADEYFVIVLSDANFDRYGIPPKHFARLLTSDSRVNAYAIFIGSLGDQADRLKDALPAGRAFVCLDTVEIPRALQQIFTSSILNVGGRDS